MARTLPTLSPSEWRLMNALWVLEKATVRQVHRHVQEETQWAQSTVKTMLDRMAAKGLLEIQRVGPVRQFAPLARRRDLVPSVIEKFLDTVLGDSLAPLVNYIAKSRRLNRAETAALRRILDQEKRR